VKVTESRKQLVWNASV